MSPRLMFIHIPKTAGTSVRAMLAEHFHAARIMPNTLDAESKINHDVIQSYDLVSGHAGTNIWGDLLSDFTSFTMLREPRARIVSLYNMYRATPPEAVELSPPRLREVQTLAKTEGLLGFLKSDHKIIVRHTHEGMVRQLSTGFISAAPPTEENLASAIETLNRMDVVGVTEMIATSLAVLHHRMGWPAPNSIPRFARIPQEVRLDTLDHETRAHLDRITTLDQRLYRFAMRRLDADASAFLNERASSSTPSRRARSEQPEISIDMAGPVPGQGWHTREGPPDAHCRWTGPDTESTFDLVLDPSVPYRLDLRLCGVMSQSIFDNMTLHVGPHKLRWRSSIKRSGEIIVRAVIPQHAVTNPGLNPLVLSVPETISHRDLDPDCPDDRKKGVCVSSVALRPRTRVSLKS